MSTVIPGICSGLTAIFLNIYDTMLEVISNFYKPKIILRNICFILGTISGVIISILLMSFIFKNSKIYLECLFLGLTLGGFIKLSKKSGKIKKVDIIIILLGILFSLIPEFMSQNTTSDYNLLLIVVGGLLSALAFVLPGISGSLLLLTLGIYEIIITSTSALLKFFIEFPNRDLFLIAIVFIISFAVGMVVFAKIISSTLQKHKEKFIKFCLGLLIGSIELLLCRIIDIELNIFIKFLFISSGVLLIKILN